MKVVCTGSTYKIYDNNLKTYDKLPAATYLVGCGQFTGFYLEKQEDVVVNEKIYGVHQAKVDKILASFKDFERNLGVILSGDKGIGKSLSAKLLARDAIAAGYPIILVNSYFEGISEFIDSITQEVVVVYDEFDKTYSEKGAQTQLLTLLDGFGSGKKLFVITCNNLNNVSEFLVNRPGRFHYHLRFGYPTHEEIREYLQDKLDPKYCGEIDSVIVFSGKVELNYDCLRAIAFELNRGSTFKEAISDLNIVNYNKSTEAYVATLICEDGTQMVLKQCYVDFSDYDEYFGLNFRGSDYRCYVEFNPFEVGYYDSTRMLTVVQGKDVSASWSDRLGNDLKKNVKQPVIKEILFKRKYDYNIHYAV
jgi:hypothetical protein